MHLSNIFATTFHVSANDFRLLKATLFWQHHRKCQMSDVICLKITQLWMTC